MTHNVASAVEATAALTGRTDTGLSADVVTVSPSAQQRIADAYNALPLYDRDPMADAAWRAFAVETAAQWQALHALGWAFTVADVDPYASAADMFADVAERRITVLSTRATGGHPVLADSVNDTFRAVHDILGHAATGRGFDRHGEEAAYQAHARMYSPLARLAMATETRGQNAAMIAAGGVFAPQKIAILPEWARDVDALIPTPDERDDARRDAAERHAAQGLSPLFGEEITAPCRYCGTDVTYNGADMYWRDGNGDTHCAQGSDHWGQE